MGGKYITKYRATYGIGPQAIVSTRDGMGIVVPEEMYRPLSGDDPAQIKDYRPTGQEIQERSEEAMHLLRQGYPGAALKLGKDIWIYKDFRETSYALLDAAYATLNRELLRKLLDIAIASRKECDAK